MQQLKESKTLGPKAGCAIFLAIVAFDAVFIGVMLASGEFNCIPVVILLIFPAIFGWIFLHPIFQEWKVAKPEIFITPDRVRVGETVTLHYSQYFKRDAEVLHYKFQLFLRESATYRRGTDTVTVTHDHKADEFGYPAQVYTKGHTIQDQWQVQIPADSMHTFKANRNKLQWFIRIDIGIKGAVDFKRDYEIVVVPERV